MKEEFEIGNFKRPIPSKKFNQKKWNESRQISQANSSELAGVTKCTNVDRKTRALIGWVWILPNLMQNDSTMKVDMKADRTGKN